MKSAGLHKFWKSITVKTIATNRNLLWTYESAGMHNVFGFDSQVDDTIHQTVLVQPNRKFPRHTMESKRKRSAGMLKIFEKEWPDRLSYSDAGKHKPKKERPNRHKWINRQEESKRFNRLQRYCLLESNEELTASRNSLVLNEVLNTVRGPSTLADPSSLTKTSSFALFKVDCLISRSTLQRIPSSSSIGQGENDLYTFSWGGAL